VTDAADRTGSVAYVHGAADARSHHRLHLTVSDRVASTRPVRSPHTTCAVSAHAVSSPHFFQHCVAAVPPELVGICGCGGGVCGCGCEWGGPRCSAVYDFVTFFLPPIEIHGAVRTGPHRTAPDHTGPASHSSWDVRHRSPRTASCLSVVRHSSVPGLRTRRQVTMAVTRICPLLH
jgi:hypothetical protein